MNALAFPRTVALIALACRSATPPAAPSVIITPHLAGPGQTLRCEALPAGSAVRWLIDGQPAGDGPDLSHGATAGASVTCHATAPDGSTHEDRLTVHGGGVGGNVLLVILDDVSVAHVGAYHATDLAPPTPAMDRLAAEGVLFQHAWSAPTCTATRSGVLTGLYGMNTGIGHAIDLTSPGLPLSAWTLPEAIDPDDTRYVAAFGKWHLTGNELGPEAPNQHGFDHFVGSLANLDFGPGSSYNRWDRIDDGKVTRSERYATLEILAAARDALTTAPEPWFAWFALHEAHRPFAAPPDVLVPGGRQPGSSEAARYADKVQAADTAISLLMASLPPERLARTTIVVLGDNGTPKEGAAPPLATHRVKTTVYEGGVRVPLIVWGAAVAGGGRTVDDPVSYVDLFPTLAELAGVDLSPDQRASIDGKSLLPYLVSPTAPRVRDTIYTEAFGPNFAPPGERVVWDRAVQDGTYKLITHRGGSKELYNLSVDPLEQKDLLEKGKLAPAAQAAFVKLQHALEEDYAPRPL